jgi:hypothetical protein
MLGLVTALLAMGVQQILAPLEPVSDRRAAIVGSYIPNYIRAGGDLRQALSALDSHFLTAETGSTISISAELPDRVAETCPHTQPQLRSRASDLAEHVAATLTQFSVFGGGATA